MRTATAAERSAVPILVLLTLFVLVIVPILMVVYTAFRDAVPFSGSESHSTFGNFEALFEQKTVDAAINTVIVTIGGTLMATTIGCILAWLAARTNIPFKPFVHVVGILPLFISMLAATVTWALLGAGNSAYLNIIFADFGAPFRIEMRSLAGFIFVEGLYHVPYPFLLVYAALSLITSDIEEAAVVHGANQFQTTMKIIFPVVLPAILGWMILNAVMMVENIAVPQILGGPVGLETLSIRVYYLMNRIPSSPTQASAVALLLAAIVFALIYAQNFVLKGRDYRTISGKGAQQKVMSLGKWRHVAVASSSFTS
jgi:iron(III) transport system permease protein